MHYLPFIASKNTIFAEFDALLLIFSKIMQQQRFYKLTAELANELLRDSSA